MAKKGENLDFIVKLLGENLCLTSVYVRRELAKHNGKEFHRGYYCCYFWDGGPFCKNRGYQNTHKLWASIRELVSAPGEKKVYRTAFCLTPKGVERYLELTNI